MLNRIQRLGILAVFCAAPVLARAASPLTCLIDVPTADVADHYAYDLSFRFYSNGGLLTKTSFGVFPRLNIGFGLDVERFVGSQNIDLNRPTLNAKFRFFDGKRQLPALALGYDGQGYFYDKAIDKYIQRERGLYLVGSEEIFVPDLTIHGGANVYDFSNDKVYGFAGLNYIYADTLGFTFESDNMRTSRETRLNLGLRYYVTPGLSVDIADRDLWAAGRDDERIVRINYFGSF